MEELVRYIELMLVEHGCVVVPEFGAFVHQQEGARVENGTLYAPHTVVGFNRDLVHSDGLLEQMYVRQHKTDYQSAKRMLHEAVNALQETLKSEGTVRLGRIGTMSEVGGRYVFVPSSCAFLPQNLGSQSFALRKQVSNSVTIHIRKDYIRYAAACVIGLALLAVSPRVNNDNYADYASLRPIDYAAIIERNLPTEVVEEEEVTIERGHFHIVVASLDAEAAERECRKLAKEGYTDAMVVPYKRGLNRVVMASYQSKREALKAMEEVRARTGYKRAWVYCE